MGKSIFKSVNINFVLGVVETLDMALVLAVPERARSCGQVTVAPWNATGGGFSPSGGEGVLVSWLLARCDRAHGGVDKRDLGGKQVAE